MNTNKLFIIILLSLSLFQACKKDYVAPSVELTPAMARDSLYDIMNEWYYWKDDMPVVIKNNYADPYLLLDAMRYHPPDRWSFVADYDEFTSQMQGSFVGHGFRIGLDDADNARIVLIYSRSPLYSQGVRRGWIVKKINGTDVAPILKSHNAAAYSSLIGPGKAGITNIFLFGKPDGTEETISSTKSSFILNPVLLYDTLHLSTGITGHLVFESFTTEAEDELAKAFSFFKSNGIQDLILDLRYNSGGYLYIAQELASYIGGSGNQGSEFIKLLYNDLHPEQNVTIPLLSGANSFSFPRIVVITSRETASASECVMNGLKPYMNIITIGDTTNGKPVGMDGEDIEKKYIFAEVRFKIVNKNEEGDFFDGIPPSFLVSDDITHDFDDREEFCLKESVNYLETGIISAKGVSVFKRHPQFSEKPAWLNNAFVIDK